MGFEETQILEQGHDQEMNTFADRVAIATAQAVKAALEHITQRELDGNDDNDDNADRHH